MSSLKEKLCFFNPLHHSRKTRRNSSILSLLICICLMLSLFSVTSTAYAWPNPVQVYYITLPEADALTALDAINTAANAPMYTYFSISIGVNGTLVYYDQWEDGYAVDLANPTSGEIYSASNLDGVQIWGNGEADDGCPPNKLGVALTCTDATDLLYAGDIIIPYNQVTVPRVSTANSYVLDNFTTQAYNNNNGNTNWSSSWVETGDDGSASDGTIYISGASDILRFRYVAGNSILNDSLDRGVDLSTGGSCATLGFTLGQDNIDANEDRLAVQASSDGTNYTTLETFDAPGDAGTKSYSISGYATANTRIRFIALDPLESATTGERWTIDNVRVDWNCSLPIFFDGSDKIGTTKSTSMARMVWATGSGTLNAYAHELYPSIVWGQAYESPVGTNTSNAGAMFEYSALSIMANSANTNVNIDANADGTYETTVNLDEGENYLVSGISQGARVRTLDAGKSLQVTLLTGDVGSTYASRDLNLLPTIGYGSGYWSPVGDQTGTTAYYTRLYLYNPSTNGSIYITCQVFNSGTPTVPTVSTLGPIAPRGVNSTIDLSDGQGAYCFASLSNGTATTDPIFAVGTIDTTNSAFDGSFTMYPDYFLTTEALVGLGLGRDPTYDGGSNNQNGGPIWVTPACPSGTNSTYVYVDWNNDGTADYVDLNGDGDYTDTVNGISEATSNNGMSIYRLQSVRLFEPPLDAEFYDQSGARVWSRTASGVGYGGTPGCKIATVWAEIPDSGIISEGSPGLDVATSIPPYNDSPTAASVSELSATRLDQAIQLDWESFSEIDILGFKLYRSADPSGADRILIYETQAKQSGYLWGDVYQHIDNDIQSGFTFTYWLEISLMNGTIATRDPVTVTLVNQKIYLPVIVR